MSEEHQLSPEGMKRVEALGSELSRLRPLIRDAGERLWTTTLTELGRRGIKLVFRNVNTGLVLSTILPRDEGDCPDVLVAISVDDDDNIVDQSELEEWAENICHEILAECLALKTLVAPIEAELLKYARGELS